MDGIGRRERQKEREAIEEMERYYIRKIQVYREELQEKINALQEEIAEKDRTLLEVRQQVRLLNSKTKEQDVKLLFYRKRNL